MGTLAAGEMVKLDETGDWVSFNSVGLNKTATNTSGISRNGSIATISAGFATDTYLVGSSIAMPSGGPLVGSMYRLTFDMVKTNAGTATPILIVRFGTAGSTADTARLTFTFGAGTAAIDTGVFDVVAHWRNVGASSVLVGTATLRHALAATGLTSTGTGGDATFPVVSSAFDSTVAGSIIGASFNGGTSFSGTCTLVQSQLIV
jgi:hypothetical protein